jgi:hypothetical protein
MSPQLFATAFVAGAALVALWAVTRTLGRAPSSLWAVLAHVLLANVASSVVLGVAVAAVPTVGPVAAIMLFAFPPLVYFFVACAWLLLFLQRLLAPSR